MSSSDRCLEDELSAPIKPSKSSAFSCCRSCIFTSMVGWVMSA